MKYLAILEVSPAGPTDYHKALFAKRSDCDYFFVTHDTPVSGGLAYNPKWTWAMNRNDLAARVPKLYEYYCFIDYDVLLSSASGNDIVTVLIDTLKEWNPAVLVTRSSSGRVEKADAENMRKGNPVGPGLFGNNMVKIVHHSLLPYFFPLPARFGGFWDCCQIFNMLEAVPFSTNVLRVYDISHKSAVSSPYAHNADNKKGEAAMLAAFQWLQEAILPHHPAAKLHSVDAMKRYYQEQALHLEPSKKPRTESYLIYEFISSVWDLRHQHFKQLFTDTGPVAIPYSR
jgi:hypothetical protein